MKKLTLKQCILKLPEIDKDFSFCKNNGILYYKKRIAIVAPAPTISELHAAALTIGHEIWWQPWGKGYNGYWLNHGIEMCAGYFKNPDLAIGAAFIAAVQDKVKK